MTQGSQQNSSSDYLALGDSYTIGESVSESERWPNQLQRQLTAKGVAIRTPEIIAKTGWRTDQLLAAVNEGTQFNKYKMVSLLIGVNNQYQKKPIAVFQKEFNSLLDKSIELCLDGQNGVFVLTIPDYGVTPFAGEAGPSISQDLKKWNEAILEICTKRKINCYNITEISKKAGKEKDLTASDGLHPSGKMYELWVNSIVEDVLPNLAPRKKP